ncbi:MAG: hypothetical protein J5833_02280 [Victivallales bacterium]|nr:hypothetical protein [Victivallales bacterium]
MTSAEGIAGDVKFVSSMLSELLEYSKHVKSTPAEQFTLTRGTLSFIKVHAETAEELFDAMGARNNSKWFVFRETVALLKNFSTSSYELLHLFFAAPFYGLGDELEGFKAATSAHIDFVCKVLRGTICNLHDAAESLGISIGNHKGKFKFMEFGQVPKLPRNKLSDSTVSVKNRIDAMAINVLNTTEDVRNFKKLSAADPAAWDKLDFDFLNEMKFRSMEVNMHNLQSLYDTYISDSATEDTDSDLRKVRGRISAVFHLMRIASIYVHFYERHIRNKPLAESGKCDFMHPAACLNCLEFYDSIISYLAHYIEFFMEEARHLCSMLLTKYCVQKTVEVKTPPYVGFHVRPSSLIAAIVVHYGCAVHMRLWDTEYDASVPFNIMMANNFLDQKKRAFIIEKIHSMDFSDLEAMVADGVMDRMQAAHQAILRLTSLNYVRLYKIPLETEQATAAVAKSTSFQDYVFNLIVFLMNNNRQLGIVFESKVSFTGPEQAVDDIAALAESNYGESETGEDLPLPKQLEYLNLRRKTFSRKRV